MKINRRPLQPFLDGIDTIHYTTAGLLNDIAFDAVFDGQTTLSRKYVLHRYLNLLADITDPLFRVVSPSLVIMSSRVTK